MKDILKKKQSYIFCIRLFRIGNLHRPKNTLNRHFLNILAKNCEKVPPDGHRGVFAFSFTNSRYCSITIIALFEIQTKRRLRDYAYDGFVSVFAGGFCWSWSGRWNKFYGHKNSPACFGAGNGISAEEFWSVLQIFFKQSKI